MSHSCCSAYFNMNLGAPWPLPRNPHLAWCLKRSRHTFWHRRSPYVTTGAKGVLVPPSRCYPGAWSPSRGRGLASAWAHCKARSALKRVSGCPIHHPRLRRKLPGSIQTMTSFETTSNNSSFIQLIASPLKKVRPPNKNNK